MYENAAGNRFFFQDQSTDLDSRYKIIKNNLYYRTARFSKVGLFFFFFESTDKWKLRKRWDSNPGRQSLLP